MYEPIATLFDPDTVIDLFPDGMRIAYQDPVVRELFNNMQDLFDEIWEMPNYLSRKRKSLIMRRLGGTYKLLEILYFSNYRKQDKIVDE